MSRMKHGTRSMYVYGSCRCEACVTANNDYARKAKARRIARGVPTTIKHGVSTYQNWGCRCSVCTKANSAACRRYQEARARGFKKAEP